MRSDSFSFKADDRKQLHVHRFLPDEGVSVRAVVHIAHGMAEHGARYARLAASLTGAGYAVYADDHRGHGKTARNDAELGHFGGPGGFQRVVSDLVELIASEKGRHPGVPAVIMGHSMGSYLARGFLARHGGDVDAAILSATSGKPSPLAIAGKLVARIERARLGPAGKSAIIDNLAFGGFNKPFAPNRTRFDWLSRDEAEVDKYVADPHCGFRCSNQLWIDLLAGLDFIASPAAFAGVPKDMPVYVFAGDRDPVGENGKGPRWVAEQLRGAGVRDVTLELYPDGRHEMVNETNRDEVTKGLLAWLDAHLPKRP